MSRWGKGIDIPAASKLCLTFLVMSQLSAQKSSVLAQALVTGIYGGDAKQLSMAATFPDVPAMEREHGSLFKAMSAKRRKAKESGEKPSRPVLWSFRGGLIELTDRLAERVGPVLQLDATAYPGNSGSPVYLPDTGEVVGILSSVFVKESKERVLSDPSGISYAIPIQHAQKLLKRISAE